MGKLNRINLALAGSVRMLSWRLPDEISALNAEGDLFTMDRSNLFRVGEAPAWLSDALEGVEVPEPEPVQARKPAPVGASGERPKLTRAGVATIHDLRLADPPAARLHKGKPGTASQRREEAREAVVHTARHRLSRLLRANTGYGLARSGPGMVGGLEVFAGELPVSHYIARRQALVVRRRLGLPAVAVPSRPHHVDQNDEDALRRAEQKEGYSQLVIFRPIVQTTPEGLVTYREVRAGRIVCDLACAD